MKIYKPEVLENGNEIKIQVPFDSIMGSDYLWYSFDKKYKDYLTTEKLDGFLVGLLLLAMKNKEDIYLEHPVSEKLYYNLSKYYIKILSIINPKFSEINIFPTSFDNGISYNSKNAVGTGFSAGVDSFSAIYDHIFNPKTPKSYTLTHLVFNNVGSHDEFNQDRAKELFKERYNILKNYTEEIGKDFIKIDSNISQILNLKFQLTHTTRNLSSILLLQKLFSKYYYASGLNYKDCFIGKTYDMAYSDPSAVNLLSTETLQFIPTGSQYTRTQKTEIISDYEPTYGYLNVCIQQKNKANNCSVCSKCFRTIFTLELLGKINLYDKTFDLKKYYRIRNKNIINILKNKRDPLCKELIALMKEKKYKLPFEVKSKLLMTGFLPSKQKVKSDIKAILSIFSDRIC